MHPNVIRYLVRSKDRVTGSPADFTVVFRNPIPNDNPSMWVKVQSIAIPSFPYGSPKATAVVKALDTRAFIDVCSDLVVSNNSDTELGQGLKASGEPTLLTVPYSRQPSDGVARVFVGSPWLKARNPGNLGIVSFKLFSDLGLPLACRSATGGDTASGTSLGATIPASGVPIQTAAITLGTAVAGLAVGQEISGLTAIRGDVTVVGVTDSTHITIGFTRQVVPAVASGTALTVWTGAAQESLSDWCIELLVTSDPVAHESPI